MRDRYLVVCLVVSNLGIAVAQPHSTIYVSVARGSDANTGSLERPYKTIAKAAQAALANQRQNISTTVEVSPGLYRESIQLGGAPSNTLARITFQAAQAGTVVITGSDQWTDWRPASADPGLYQHAWPFHWGQCTWPAGWPHIDEIGLKREMIFVAGKPLDQVLSLAQIRDGAFFADEEHGTVYIRPAASQQLEHATVEVAVRPALFESSGVSHLTLRGLVFEHANSCISTKPNAAVEISGGTDNLLDSVQIRWNNWIGLDYFSSTSSAVRNSTFLFNGESGINGFRLKDALFENVDASSNNWRGALGHFLRWEPSGGKFTQIHGALFEGFVARNNQGQGIWFDTDNASIVLDHAFLVGNAMGGVALEAGISPITIMHSRICSNAGSGILNNHAESVTLFDDVIYNNTGTQIALVSVGSRPSTNWETKEHFTALSQNWVMRSNLIVGTRPEQLLYETLPVSGQGSDRFLQTLVSEDNTWFNPTSVKVFQLVSARGEVRTISLPEWQAITGQDATSRFAAPASSPEALCTVPPSFGSHAK